jgi:hypothetical protein
MTTTVGTENTLEDLLEDLIQLDMTQRMLIRQQKTGSKALSTATP